MISNYSGSGISVRGFIAAVFLNDFWDDLPYTKAQGQYFRLTTPVFPGFFIW